MHSLPAKAESSFPSHTERPRRKGGPRTSAEAEAEADAETEAKAKADAETEAKAKADAETEAKAEAKSRSKFRTSHKGGDSAGDPPLPIPNREVKPRYADGTAKVGE